jgi:type I restriction enzyme, S subunit
MKVPWPFVSMREVLTPRKEFIQIDDLKAYKRCRVQLHAQGIVLRDTILGAEIKTKKQQVCHAGEFLVAEIDAKVGGFGIVPESLEGAIVSSHYFLFMLDERSLDQKYLDYFIRTRSFRDQVTAQGSTNYAAIRPEDVLGYQIPLPLLEEQRRIVARIEELAARIEEARELRRRASEEADALMNKYAEYLFDNNNCNMQSIETICDVKGGIQKSSERSPGANPRRYVTVAHVQRNWIDTSDPRYFEVSDEELEKWRLLPGDVLVIEGNGSADQIGRTALFRGEIEDCVHQNHVIRIRPNQMLILPEYLNDFLNSPPGQKQMRERSRTTSGLFNLSVGRIKSIDVPLPSFKDQQRIVEKLQEMQSKIAALRCHQAETAAALDALLPAVLERAFRGEL